MEFQGSCGMLAARRWTMGERPVLAFHGWLDNAGTFDRLAPYLEGLDLVCVDFPGHGLSQHRPQHMAYHFVDWVPEVFAAADHMGWERFGLMGHSMGAAVSALAAGTFPERIVNLVLIEGLGPYASPEEEAPELLAKALRHRPSVSRRFYKTREEAVRRLTSRGLLHASAECLAQRALQETERGWAFTYAPSAKAPSRFRLSEGQVRAFFREITCPSLLVSASDGLKPLPSFVGREEEIKNLKPLQLEGGGHHIHLDYPERIWKDVLEHLLGSRLPV
jgi:pimeloyl-ACP methyl ester carboxylesterase